MALTDEEYKLSEYISDFLDFLEATAEQLGMSEGVFEEAQLELQDIEHFMELKKTGATQNAKLAVLLKETRRKRRTAKENIEICTPINEWKTNNKEVINSLRQLLGKVRKVESLQSSRRYAFRTHILDGITNETHIKRE